MSVDEIQCSLLVEQLRERRGRNFLENKYLMLLERLEMIVGEKKKNFGRMGTNIAVQEWIFDCVVENMGAGRSELHIAWKDSKKALSS